MTLLLSSNCVKGKLLFVHTQAMLRIYTTLVCSEGLPSLNVNKYINAVWTPENQQIGMLFIYSTVRLTLSILKTLFASFKEEVSGLQQFSASRIGAYCA